jgi:hypothetical protein
MIHFLNITLQAKSEKEDWRAFLDWADRDTMKRYQLRGYGATPGEAADDAWRRFNEDKWHYCEFEQEWV